MLRYIAHAPKYCNGKTTLVSYIDCGLWTANIQHLNELLDCILINLCAWEQLDYKRIWLEVNDVMQSMVYF